MMVIHKRKDGKEIKNLERLKISEKETPGAYKIMKGIVNDYEKVKIKSRG